MQCAVYFFFFFSSRRRHTRSLCDWSSDVCSSDLSTRADTTNLMKQRSTKRTAKNPLGDSEINTIIRFQVKHIERCMAARLESYQRAYEETGKVPTEEELEEILEELRTVGGLQVKHSSSFIENFLRAKRAPVQCDPEQGLMEGCANAHDRSEERRVG